MLEVKKGAKVYISGPMSNMPEHNRPAFDRAFEMLKEAGYVPINPCHLNDTMPVPQRYIYAECLRVDKRELTYCDAIYMLVGWQRSPGARVELDDACVMGLSIFFEVGHDPAIPVARTEEHQTKLIP